MLSARFSLATACVCVLGCDALGGDSKDDPPPAAKAPQPSPPGPTPSAGALIEHASIEFEAPDMTTPLRAKVSASVGTLDEEHNDIHLAVACDVGGTRYVDVHRAPPPERGETFELDVEVFDTPRWDAGVALSGCSAWLTIRKTLGSPELRERLVLASCRRDGEWTTQGCPGLPDEHLPEPVRDGSVDVKMLWGRPTDASGAWGLKVLLDYGVHHHLHPGVELGATVRCSAGAKRIEFRSEASDVDLADLQPDQRARGLVDLGSQEGLGDAKPEQCEIVAALREEPAGDTHPLQTFCWTPAGVKTGKCPAAG